MVSVCTFPYGLMCMKSSEISINFAHTCTNLFLKLYCAVVLVLLLLSTPVTVLLFVVVLLITALVYGTLTLCGYLHAVNLSSVV